MFYGCGGFGGFGARGFGGFGGGPFMMIIPIALIGLVVYFIFSQMNRQGHNQTGDHNEALNILMERYARGEISEEEYVNKKKLLRR